MRDTLAFHIAALHRDFLSYTSEEMKKLGLSFGQVPFILYIGKHPGCTQADLTKKTRLDWGYSQRGIAKLVEGGFLTKTYDKEKAGNRLTLTAAGEDAFAACHSVFRSWDLIKTADLTAEEKNTLLGLLRKITAERKENQE